MKYLALITLVGCSNQIDPATFQADISHYDGRTTIVMVDEGFLIESDRWSLHAEEKQGEFLLENDRCFFIVDTPGTWDPVVCEIGVGIAIEVGPGIYWEEEGELHAVGWARDPANPDAWGSVAFRGVPAP